MKYMVDASFSIKWGPRKHDVNKDNIPRPFKMATYEYEVPERKALDIFLKYFYRRNLVMGSIKLKVEETG